MSARAVQVSVVAAILLAVGLGLCAYKVLFLDYPLVPDESTEFWTVETYAAVTGTGEPISVEIALAEDSPSFGIADEDYVDAQFGQRVSNDGGQRAITFERRSLTGSSTLFVLTRLYPLDGVLPQQSDPPSVDTAFGDGVRAAQMSGDPGPFVVALDSVIADARAQSASDTAFAQRVVAILAASENRVDALAAGDAVDADLSEPARRLAFVLEASGIPARRVAGLYLESDRRRAPVRNWVEFWPDGEATAIDPESGAILDPDILLPIAYDDAPLVSVTGGAVSEFGYAVKRTFAADISRALWRSDQEAPLVTKLTPLVLSVNAQSVFQVLLLLPVGALAIAMLRQLVGIQSFGTFMPVLIALAFRETQLVLGIVLFVGIVTVGLLLRSYFNTLHLTLVPRLSAVLSIVTLIMLAIAIGGALGGVRLGLSLSLFPIVILTMTIESMSLIWDEYGPQEAIVRAVGSLVAAIVGYLVISIDIVQHLVFIFPELLLVVIAFSILLGRYNGFTAQEFVRFRMIGRNA